MPESLSGLIIRGGLIVTLDAHNRIIPNGAIRIENGHIAAIGTSDQISKDASSIEIDASKKVVLPGLIDCHCHTQHTLARTLDLQSHDPMAWKTILHPFEEALTPAEAYVSASLCCLEMLKAGTTCFAEFPAYNIQNVDAVGKAVEKAGIRCVLGRGSKDQTSPFDPTENLVGMEDLDKSLKRNEEFIQNWHGKSNNRIKVWIGLPGMLNCTDAAFIENKKLADRYNINFGTHISSNPLDIQYCRSKWGTRPVEHLHDLGVLDEKFLGIHGVYLGEQELPLLEKNQANIIHCPRTYLRPTTKVPQMLNLGVNVALGSDAIIYDLFTMMRLTAILQERAWAVPYRDYTIFSSKQLLRMTTNNASKALLQTRQIGSLEINKKADIIVIDNNRPHLTPSLNIYEELIHLASAHDVESVIIDGQIIMEQRVIKTLNEQTIINEAQKITEKIVEQRGFNNS